MNILSPIFKVVVVLAIYRERHNVNFVVFFVVIAVISHENL